MTGACTTTTGPGPDGVMGGSSIGVSSSSSKRSGTVASRLTSGCSTTIGFSAWRSASSSTSSTSTSSTSTSSSASSLIGSASLNSSSSISSSSATSCSGSSITCSITGCGGCSGIAGRGGKGGGTRLGGGNGTRV